MPIEIPEHLRYRAPQPRSTVGEVRSRYREAKQHIDADLYYQATKPQRFRDRSPPSHNFANVSSRYREAKLDYHNPDHDVPVVPKTSSILMTDEYIRHKQFAKSCGVNNVESQWHEVPNMSNTVTPRQIIEHRQAVERSQLIKEGALFKSSVRAPRGTFGDLLAARESEGVRPASPPRKSSHSVVMNWVNNGVPIPGQEEILTPSSPRRVASPGKPVFVTGNHARPKVPQKYSAVQEERTVRQLCENMVTARTRSPPRVAYLPPKFQTQPSPERHRLSPTRPRSNASNVMLKGNGNRSVSPMTCGRLNAVTGLVGAQSTSSSRRNSFHGGDIQRTGSNMSATNRGSVYGSASAVAMPRTVEAAVRSSSPVRPGNVGGRLVVGGGVPSLTAGALRRSTSPQRGAQAPHNFSQGHHDECGEADFLPFSSVPPPQLRGRA